jgi:hypothetical protein
MPEKLGGASGGSGDEVHEVHEVHVKVHGEVHVFVRPYPIDTEPLTSLGTRGTRLLLLIVWGK